MGWPHLPDRLRLLAERVDDDHAAILSRGTDALQYVATGVVTFLVRQVLGLG